MEATIHVYIQVVLCAYKKQSVKDEMTQNASIKRDSAHATALDEMKNEKLMRHEEQICVWNSNKHAVTDFCTICVYPAPYFFGAAGLLFF